MTVQIFTLKELSFYNGQNGRPAYIAYKGNIYDVTLSYSWRKGVHYLMHRAGTDLTANLQHAPHGSDLLEAFPLVGHLK